MTHSRFGGAEDAVAAAAACCIGGCSKLICGREGEGRAQLRRSSSVITGLITQSPGGFGRAAACGCGLGADAAGGSEANEVGCAGAEQLYSSSSLITGVITHGPLGLAFAAGF